MAKRIVKISGDKVATKSVEPYVRFDIESELEMMGKFHIYKLTQESIDKARKMGIKAVKDNGCIALSETVMSGQVQWATNRFSQKTGEKLKDCFIPVAASQEQKTQYILSHSTDKGLKKSVTAAAAIMEKISKVKIARVLGLYSSDKQYESDMKKLDDLLAIEREKFVGKI